MSQTLNVRNIKIAMLDKKPLTLDVVSPKIKPKKEIQTEFGQWIKQQREDLRYSQREIAKKAGIHEIQLGRIEKGESGTKYDTVISLATAIGCDVQEALNRAGFDIPSGVYDEPLSMARQVNGSNVRAMGARLQPKDPLDEFEILPSGFEKLSKRQQSKFKKQLRALAQALIDEELDEEN